MIVLPNYFERYLASLRILITRRILKYGQRPNYIKNLKKIIIAEALYYKKSVQNIDMKNHCENLLFAIFAHKPFLSFLINSDNNHIINQQLLSLLIVSICRFSNFLKIESDKNYLYFIFCGKPKNISNIIFAITR